MNRVNKKLKQDTAKSSFGRSSNTNGSSIHSGHYMTSYLHDQNEDTVEMPIASPDAMNNDVTLNTNLNTDQDNFHDAENEAHNQNNKSQVLVSNLATKNSNNMTNVIAKKTMSSGPLAKAQAIIGTNGSISGGLTLDKTNKSLKNLMFYIKSAYSNNLTSPKWKNFKGLKLQVTEKIRLNNVIWRSWFEQYGKKETSNVKLRLICQFANGLDEKPVSQKMSKREGRFWKARLESITNEYKKWREISRKQIKACDSGENLKTKDIPRRPTPSIPQTNVNNTTSVSQLSSSFGEQTYFDNFQSNFNQHQQHQSQNYMYPPSNFSGINEFPTDFNVQSNLPTDSNFHSYGPNTPQNINSFNNFGIPSNSNYQVNYPTQTNNSVTTHSYSSHIPIASKQMPYNNRCRSPSPGLFDFDFNNFSSDTLFSTHFVEDPKDTIFGTNPDFFQPDLMHLFPNFDFFDLPGNNSDVFNLNNNNNTETNSEQNSPQATNNTQIVSDSNTPIQTFNPQSTETVSVVEVEDVNKQVHQPAISIAIDYSDLSNFDTLATVAAAQSINVSPNPSNPPPPNRPIRQRHMSDISDFNHLKSASDQSILNDVNNHLKMPVSLSQINSSLSINPIQTQFSVSSTNISTQPLRRPSGSQIQSPQSNTSSNTIRNLLALNTPTVSLQPSISPPKPTSNNMRISGILGVSGSGIPPIRKQVAPQKVIYQQEALPNLIQNSTPSPQQNIVMLSSDNNKVKTDNLTISNLLTSSVLMPQQVKIQQDINQILSQQEQFMDQTKPPPSKRGRKSTIETPGSRSNSKTNLTKPTSQTKIKKDDLQSPQISGGLVMPETIETINSPTNSPNQKLSNYNSYQNSVQTYSNPDSNFSNYSTSNKYSMPQSFSKESSYQTGRINRSDSLNSLNTEAQISTAEQKRRCNIQQGFDRLQILVPALKEGKNLKVSKAVMLQKTSEYIKELQTARGKRMADLDVYRKEIDELSDKITECQNQLPANGVSVIGNLNKTEIFEQKFNSYVKEKTMSNWKFYLFSLILKPLFDNFITSVNTSSKEDMEKTFHEWQQKYCSLAQLRPIASNALRHLSRSTSILTDSNKLPEECFSSALSKI